MRTTTFGGELRRLRLRQGMSLAALAQLVNYDASYLSRIENGHRRPTSALAGACDTALGTDGLLAAQVPVRQPHRVGSAAERQSVCTGWLSSEPDILEWPIAICGSRATGTDNQLIDSCVHSVGRLLTRLRCRVSHGPLGVGVEVMTFIADHHRPPGLDCLPGVVGRLNVVRPADYVIVIGGGTGTRDEALLASSLRKTLIPFPASGGAARDVFDLTRPTGLGPGLCEEDVAELGTVASADEYVQIVERILRRRAANPS